MIVFKNQSMVVFRSVLYETNSIVIHNDDFVLVVDPAWLPYEVEEIKSYVFSILENKPLYLLFTHSDYDHIIGCNAFPNARIIASKAFAAKSEKEKSDIVEQIKEFDDDFYLLRNYQISYPFVDWQTEFDGDTLKIGKTKLVFYQAPGHNSDGIFTVIDSLGLLITGDYFSDVEFPYIYQSSKLYEDSILKLDSILGLHSIKMLIPGHGNFTDDIEEMKKRQADSLAYIHEMREGIAQGNQEQIDMLIEGCRFPRNMKKFHKNNQQLFEIEMRVPTYSNNIKGM